MTENDAIKELSYDETAYGGRHCTEEVRKVAIQALSEVQQYRAIGTSEEFKELKEKSTPKKPIRKPNDDWTYEEVTCPTCGKFISPYTDTYCKCGQAIDWERKENEI